MTNSCFFPHNKKVESHRNNFIFSSKLELLTRMNIEESTKSNKNRKISRLTNEKKKTQHNVNRVFFGQVNHAPSS